MHQVAGATNTNGAEGGAPPEPPSVAPSATAAFARRARERMARGEPLVVAIGGNEVVIPPSLREPVLALLDRGAAGGADRAGAGLPPLPVDLPPELTSGQAADLLGVPRAVLDQLVERGEVPATRRGPRRRIATADVIAVRDRARSGRTATLADVVAASRELGLYPDDGREP